MSLLPVRDSTRKITMTDETPCDQDFLRKLAKDTEADALMRWFSTDVAEVFKTQRAFDKEGIFIGDASYLFVPDNPNYEGSETLLFDENDHPLSEQAYKKMTDEQKDPLPVETVLQDGVAPAHESNYGLFLFCSLKGSPWQGP